MDDQIDRGKINDPIMPIVIKPRTMMPAEIAENRYRFLFVSGESYCLHLFLTTMIVIVNIITEINNSIIAVLS